MTKLKLSDKEITALAKKVAEKRRKDYSARIAEKAKAKLSEAKKIIATLNALPPTIISYLYSNRWAMNSLSPAQVAQRLVEKTDEDDGYSGRSSDENIKSVEADVVLAAHDCTTLTQLCRKLGI